MFSGGVFHRRIKVCSFCSCVLCLRTFYVFICNAGYKRDRVKSGVVNNNTFFMRFSPSLVFAEVVRTNGV